METTYKYVQWPISVFLEEDETYSFHVDGGVDAPDLTVSIDFPESTPYITDPVNQQTVSRSGFTVTWEGSEGPGDLHLGIIPAGGGGNGVYAVTANDGSHTFTSGDLSGVPSGQAAITLNYFNHENIDAAGYDEDSYIEAKVTHGVLITLQ